MTSYRVSSRKIQKVRSFVYLKKVEVESASGYHNCQEDGCKPIDCAMNALRTFLRTFGVAFGLRAGLAFALRVLSLAKTNPKALLSLEELINEKNLKVRVDAVRLGLFCGIFTGGFNYLHCCLRRYATDVTPKKERIITLIAGFLAGLSILTQTKTRRRWFALLALVRLLQCLYNETKRRKWFKPLFHGDALLFMIASAQVMYAYVMRPETLPASYHKFIVNSGPIHGKILQVVRNNCRGIPFDEAFVTKYVRSHISSSQATSFSISQNPLPMIGCDILHPMEPFCSRNFGHVFLSTFKKIFPLYVSLTFVPMFVLRLFKLFKDPINQIGRGIFSAARSTAFLATFCAGYQGIICSHHNVAKYGSKAMWWIAGFITSLSILIERQPRRSELALYTMPRSLDSAWLVLQDHGLVPTVPYGDVMVFCLSVSGLMYFYHNHPYRTVSPFLTKVFNWLFDKKRQEIKEDKDIPSPILSPISTSSNSHLK